MDPKAVALPSINFWNAERQPGLVSLSSSSGPLLPLERGPQDGSSDAASAAAANKEFDGDALSAFRGTLPRD
ncbi:hypothetical protein RRF57_012827 [Xylaria bambusicola]|uniref:Uncharacterized protein n=1 Tax=Xylaria bambusicola TaxID=326684 RepID=A0AAN7Z4U6_9PEZI